MTEQQSNEKSLIKAQAQEIQSLNFDGLDITELEHRLEMASFYDALEGPPLDDDKPSCETNTCWVNIH